MGKEISKRETEKEMEVSYHGRMDEEKNIADNMKVRRERRKVI